MKSRMLFTAVAVLFALSGCTQFTGYKASSHLGFPNANVTPIGPGSGDTTKCNLFLPALITSDMQEDAISQAVSSRGGDMLINFAEFQTQYVIPLMFITINCVKYTVEGTVAKQEIGLQKLN